jgi:glutamine amidotransferase
MFQKGDLSRTVNIPVPEEIAKKAAEPLAKACVGSALEAGEIRTTAAVESELGIE